MQYQKMLFDASSGRSYCNSKLGSTTTLKGWLRFLAKTLMAKNSKTMSSFPTKIPGAHPRLSEGTGEVKPIYSAFVKDGQNQLYWQKLTAMIYPWLEY